MDRDELRKKLQAWTDGKIPPSHEKHVRDAQAKTHGGRGRNKPTKSKGWKASQHRRDKENDGTGPQERGKKRRKKGRRGRRSVVRVQRETKGDRPEDRLGPGETLRTLPDGRTFIVSKRTQEPAQGAGKTPAHPGNRPKQKKARGGRPGKGSAKPGPRHPWGHWQRELQGVPVAGISRSGPWSKLLRIESDDLSDSDFIHVGIDAGTSGIRIATQTEFDETFQLFDFGPNQAGGSRFSMPALAGYAGHEIVFGNDAAELPWERRFTSFKAGLLYPNQSKGASERWAELELPYSDALRSTHGPRVPELLYAASIGRALTVGLPALVGDLEGRFLSFSVGAPLDGTDTTRRRFSRCFAAGLLLGGLVEERMDPKRLVECFATAWRDARGLAEASEEERRVHVRHEALLLIRSLEDLITEGRTFLVADIGASTTEVSVLRKGSAALRAWESRSLPLGVDRADLEAGSGKRVDLLKKRRARMDGRGGTGGIQPLVNALRPEVRRVIHGAVQRNPDERSWSELRIVVAGGGSNIPELRQAIEKGERPHHWVTNRVGHRPTIPEVGVVGHSAAPPRKDEIPEVVCVLGAARSPDEDIEYTTERPETVIPFYENPLSELYKKKYSSWL